MKTEPFPAPLPRSSLSLWLGRISGFAFVWLLFYYYLYSFFYYFMRGLSEVFRDKFGVFLHFQGVNNGFIVVTFIFVLFALIPFCRRRFPLPPEGLDRILLFFGLFGSLILLCE